MCVVKNKKEKCIFMNGKLVNNLVIRKSFGRHCAGFTVNNFGWLIFMMLEKFSCIILRKIFWSEEKRED